MVDVEVLPSKGLPGHLPGNLAIWRGREGSMFTTSIGKRRRDLLVNYIANRCHQLPVKVSLVKLHRILPDTAYLTMLDGVRKVGFVHRNYFLLFNCSDVKESILDQVGETVYSCEEIVELVDN